MFALLETNFVSPLSASAGLTKWTTDGSEARWQVGSRDEHISHVYEDVLPCAPSPRGRAPSGVAEGCGAWRHPPSVPWALFARTPQGRHRWSCSGDGGWLLSEWKSTNEQPTDVPAAAQVLNSKAFEKRDYASGLCHAGGLLLCPPVPPWPSRM